MMRLCSAVAIVCITIFGCDADPARSVRIIPRPIGSMKPRAPQQAPSVPVPKWRPNLCPPPPESTRGPGTLVATGDCNFEHHGFVECSALGDDFIFGIDRPSAKGSTISIFVNVEGYHGPDKYDYAQILVSVSDAKGYFRWRSFELSITVGEGEKFVKLESTHLEPLLTDGATSINVAGKLWCRPPAGKHRMQEL
jgi:hypothetical protein